MKNSRKIRDLFVTGVVSCMGLGFFPKGSGTAASFFAVGFWVAFLVLGFSKWMLLLSCGILIWAGVYFIKLYEKRTRTADSSVIVIDEWVGMGLSLLAVNEMNLLHIVAAFLLFRLFDIWKPPGVRYFDQNHLAGWGVMLDDVVAGLYAALLIGVYRWSTNS